ncbi:hypothetical protein JCM9279_003586 [Rhodotorula babjevae]
MPPAHALLSSPLHRIPTLWSLFRPLLRAARTAPLAPPHRAALEQHVRDGFRRGRRLGSVERARNKLGEAEQFLHHLDSASHSSAHLDRLRALAAHLVQRRPPSSPFPSRSPSLKHKPPFLAPSLLPSTPFAPPLARLRPQPRSTSLMIHRRRRASQRRFDLLERARDVVRLAEGEDEFERALGVGVRVRGGGGGGGGGGEGRWGDEWRKWILDARASEAREQARNALVVPPALQHRAREAARERERRRGERARAALRRRRERDVNLER